MKTIMLVCNAGMSTSILVTKMQEVAKKKDLSVEIFAVPSSAANEKLETMKIDVLLLGPQVRYLEKEYASQLENTETKVAVIDMLNYGQMKGEAVLESAYQIMGNKD